MYKMEDWKLSLWTTIVSSFKKNYFQSFICVVHRIVVEVLFPAGLTVQEDAGVAQLCVSLSSSSQTQREVSVELAMVDKSALGWSTNSCIKSCSYVNPLIACFIP